MGLELFNEISVEIDGEPFFSVENYHTYAVRQIRLVESFGQADVAGIAAGNPRYQVELSRVRRSGEEDLYALSDFSVVISRLQSRTVYTGCEWESIEEKTETDGAVTETIRLTALNRMELPA